MSDPESMKIIEAAAAKRLDEIIAADKQHRFGKPEGFRWLTLNNLRLRLASLPASDLAEIAKLGGALILQRFPGPTP